MARLFLVPRLRHLAAAAALIVATLAPIGVVVAVPLPLSRVVFVGPHGEVPVAVEVARTARESQVGYMYRLYVPPYGGMLFIMPEQRVQAFWMRNTVTSLDMIFVDDDRRVVGIVHRATPVTDDLRFVHRPSRFIIEVAGGFCRQAGIGAGDTVRFEGVGGF